MIMVTIFVWYYSSKSYLSYNFIVNTSIGSSLNNTCRLEDNDFSLFKVLLPVYSYLALIRMRLVKRTSL